MAYNANKTEHSGAKKGRGAYWGIKKEAKNQARKKEEINLNN